MNLSTYGDAGPLSSVGEPCTADPFLGLLDIRGGEKLDGVLFGGAKDGRFLGLGLRVGCGDDKGAAAADATAVDMVDGDDSSSSRVSRRKLWRKYKVLSLCIDLINLLRRMQGHLELMRARSGKRIETWDRPRYIQVGDQRISQTKEMESRAVRRQAAV